MGAIAATAIPAAISIGSSLLGNAVTDQPEVPDFSKAAQDEVDAARRRQRGQAEEQREDLEETLSARSASGVISSGAREEMFDAQASAASELESKAADIISNAIRKEKMAEFERESKQAQNRARAISDIGQGLSTAAISAGLGQNMDFGGGDVGGPVDDGVGPGQAGEFLEGKFPGSSSTPAGQRGDVIDAIQFGNDL